MEVKSMSTKKIRVQTLSTGALTDNAVYRAKIDTVLILGKELIDVQAGSLAIISGCGAQKGLHDRYLLGDHWAIGVNKDWEHYANPIRMRANF